MEAGVIPALSVESCPAARGVDVVAVVGELEFETVATFRRELHRLGHEGRSRLVLDLSELRFLDSSGLAALLTVLQSAEGAGGRLAVACDGAHVNDLLETTGLAKILGLVSTREQAVAVLAEHPQ
jgi:anti-sigma B factor antagonist